MLSSWVKILSREWCWSSAHQVGVNEGTIRISLTVLIRLDWNWIVSLSVCLTTCKASFSSVNIVGLSWWVIRQILCLVLAAPNRFPEFYEPTKALWSNQNTCDKKKNNNACNHYTSNATTWKASFTIILLNIWDPICCDCQCFIILSCKITAVKPELDSFTLSGIIVSNALSCLVNTAFAALAIAAIRVNKWTSSVIRASCRKRGTHTINLIELITQKYIEFIACLIALFGENKCGLIRF